MKFAFSSLEVLEQRIAPASLTFTDVDGDTVKVTTSKGSLAALTAGLTLLDSGMGKLLQKLDLTSPAFQGSDLSIVVTTPAGDSAGMVQVGEIDAHGRDLGRVTIGGVLGRLEAGDSQLGTPALKGLEVAGLGAGEDAAAGASVLHGGIAKLEIAGNLTGSLLLKGAGAGVGRLHVGGALQGSEAAGSGSIRLPGGVGFLQVDGNFLGAAGEFSGSIRAGGSIVEAQLASLLGGAGAASGSLQTSARIATLHLSGSVTGSTAAMSGAENGTVIALNLGSVTIAGAVQGGSASTSGVVEAKGVLRSISVEGGLQGGTGQESGAIIAGRFLQKATLGTVGAEGATMLAGGSGLRSGSLLSGAAIGRVEIFGKMLGGSGETSGGISAVGSIAHVKLSGAIQGGLGSGSGAIGALGRVDQVEIVGSLTGGSGPSSGRVVSVSGLGVVTVTGDIIGGLGEESGSVGTLGSFHSLHVTGSLKGGSGHLSGVILVNHLLQQLAVDGSIRGGTGPQSGRVEVGYLGKGEVTTDLQGGQGVESGTISIRKHANLIKVGGSIRGLGQQGTAGQAASAAGNGSIDGPGLIEKVEVVHDVVGGQASFSGSIGTAGGLTSVVIGGTLQGGMGDSSGTVYTRKVGDATVGGNIGLVVVQQTIFGGKGVGSGGISSAGFLGKVEVTGANSEPTEGTSYAGSVVGGTGPFSGSIFSQRDLGSVQIFGDLRGSSGGDSGKIYTLSSIGQVAITGDMSGATSSAGPAGSSQPGQIAAPGRIRQVLIQGDMEGRDAAYSGSIVGGSLGQIQIDGDVITGAALRSAAIVATQQNLATLVVGGSLRPRDSASLAPYIAAAGQIGSITAGSIFGQDGGASSQNPVAVLAQIRALGLLHPATSSQALTIGVVQVRDLMALTQIIAGQDAQGAVANAGARIGRVEVGTVDGDAKPWNSNDIIAGFATGDDGRYGTDDDMHPASSSSLHAQIAKVIIHGVPGDDRYFHGIEAAEVGAVVINGQLFGLQKGPQNDHVLPLLPGLFTRVNEGFSG